MNVRQIILAILSSGALFLAHGAEGLAVGGRLISDSGQVFASGSYRLEAAFATNETATAFLTSSVPVKTDSAGNYLTTLPVSVDALATAGPSVWIRQSFSTTNGAFVAVLPPQRLGAAPAALHASAAERLVTTNGAYAVESLTVSNALKSATLVVTNRLLASGTLAVKGLSTEQAVDSTLRVDQLSVGSLGTTLFGRVAGETVVGSLGDAVTLEAISVEADGLFELTLVTNDAVGFSASLWRQSESGAQEQLCALEAPETIGATRRVLTAPVHAGDVLSATASCGASGRITATYDFVYLGTQNGGTSPGGEQK